MSQERIDSIAYPCTHEYILDPLEPTGHLKRRVDLMPKEFFTGSRFLDIGSNKGFFSLFAKKNNMEVDAIDIIPEYVDLCNDLGINTILTSFRDFNPDKRYDRIMAGNVLHYMFRECDGWEFICKLAAISTGLVLIEAPLGMECGDMKGVLKPELESKYNKKSFMKEMEKYFKLTSISPSPSPDRYIMLFERKNVEIRKVKDNTIEIFKKSDGNTEKDIIRILVASMSPISNGLLALTYKNNTFIGWIEEISKTRILLYKEKQNEVFNKICEHNIFLAKLGYTDVDNATINFFENLRLFDKGGVYHIKDVKQEWIEKDKHFTIMTKNSYDDIDIDKILKALNTRDSNKIQKCYEDMKWA